MPYTSRPSNYRDMSPWGQMQVDAQIQRNDERVREEYESVYKKVALALCHDASRSESLACALANPISPIWDNVRRITVNMITKSKQYRESHE